MHMQRVEATLGVRGMRVAARPHGMGGLHRYNNLDHSMLTAMRAVDNILLGAHHDIWAVNAESVYHEEHQENEDPYRESPDTPAMEQPLASER